MSVVWDEILFTYAVMVTFAECSEQNLLKGGVLKIYDKEAPI